MKSNNTNQLSDVPLLDSVNELQASLTKLLARFIDKAKEPDLPMMKRVGWSYGTAVLFMVAMVGKVTQMSLRTTDFVSHSFHNWFAETKRKESAEVKDESPTPVPSIAYRR